MKHGPNPGGGSVNRRLDSVTLLKPALAGTGQPYRSTFIYIYGRAGSIVVAAAKVE